MDGTGLGVGSCRYGNPNLCRRTWRSRPVRIIRSVTPWKGVPFEGPKFPSRKPPDDARAGPLHFKFNNAGGSCLARSAPVFSQYLYAILQKDYAVGYLGMAMLSKGTTAMWVIMEVVAANAQNPAAKGAASSQIRGLSALEQDASAQERGSSACANATASAPSHRYSVGAIFMRMLQELAAPCHFINQIGSSILLPSAAELADLLHLKSQAAGGPPVGSTAAAGVGRSPSSAPGSQHAHDLDGGFPLPTAANNPPANSAEVGSDGNGSQADGGQPDDSAVGDESGDGGSGDGGGGGGDGGGSGDGGGGDGGEGGGGGNQGQPQDDGPAKSRLWLAVALSLALVLPPNGLVELVRKLSRPLLPPDSEPQRHPRLALRVSPRKRRFALLQHAAAQALDGEGVLLLNPRSAAAALLFPASKTSQEADSSSEEETLQNALAAVAAVPDGPGDVLGLPLPAQLIALANAVTAAYERETRLAARLMTRRAIAFAVNNEKISALTAKLDASSAALAQSKHSILRLVSEMEDLSRELDFAVFQLSVELSSVIAQRDALLAEVDANRVVIEGTTAAHTDLAAKLLAAEAERDQVRAQLAEVRTCLEESDASVWRAHQERDQGERAGTSHQKRDIDSVETSSHGERSAVDAKGSVPLQADDELLADDTADIAVSLGSPTRAAQRDGAAFSFSPVRAALRSAQHRTSKLLRLQQELTQLQERMAAQAAAHAADAAALARAEQDAGNLRTQMASLEPQLVEAAQIRQELEEALASTRAQLEDAQEQLRMAIEELCAARTRRDAAEAQLQDVRGQLQGALAAAEGSEQARQLDMARLAAASAELDASQAEQVSLGLQLHHSQQELLTARTHLRRAQNHVTEALVEKNTLRSQLMYARQRQEAAEAEVTMQGERCRATEAAATVLTAQLAEVRAQVISLTAQLQEARGQAGSALGLGVALRAQLEELKAVQERAATCATAASQQLKAEVIELQVLLAEAQAARQAAEQDARELQDRSNDLELQLAQTKTDHCSAVEAQEQRLAALQADLLATEAALSEAQGAAADARKAEALQTSAVAAAAVTVADLQDTVQQLRESLNAVNEELRQLRADSAATAAAAETQTAFFMQQLEARAADDDALRTQLVEAAVGRDRQLAATQAATQEKTELQMHLLERLRELQSKVDCVETAAATAANLRRTRLAEIQAACEEGRRSMLDLQARLAASEAARQGLVLQVLEAEGDRDRLNAQLAVSTAEQLELQGELRTVVQHREALEEAGSEVMARLKRAEEVLSEALGDLHDANSALRLHHRMSLGHVERLELHARAEAAAAECRDLRSQLSQRLAELQVRMVVSEVASTEAIHLYGRHIAVLEMRGEVKDRLLRDMQEELLRSESTRTQLLEQVAVSEMERQRLSQHVAESEQRKQELQSRLTNAEAEQQLMHGQLAETEEERLLLLGQVSDAESWHQGLQRQLSEAEADRRRLTQHLAEREAGQQELQMQVEEAEARHQAAQSRLTEVEARESRLVQQMAEADARQQELQRGLAAVVMEMLELQTRLAEARVRQQELQELVGAANKRSHSLEAQVAEDKALIGEMQARIHNAEATQRDVEAQLSDMTSAVRQQKQHLESAHAEKLDLQAQIADMKVQHRELGVQLAILLHRLEDKVENAEAASTVASGALAAEVTDVYKMWREEEELLARAERAEADARRMAAELAQEEVVRSEYLSRLADAQAEHRRLQEENQVLQARMARGEEAYKEIRARLERSEADGRAARSALADANTALLQLQERLNLFTSERDSLQTQLTVSMEERGRVQTQVAELLLEIKSKINAVATTSASVEASLTARTEELQQRCEQEAAVVAELRLQLQAREAERRELEDKVAQTDIERARMRAEMAAMQEQQARIRALADAEATTQRTILEEALAAAGVDRQALLEQIGRAEDERRELQARLGAAEATHAAALVDAAASLSVLEQRVLGAEMARLDSQARLAATAEELDNLRAQLAAGLKALQERMHAANAASAAAIAAQAAQVRSLQERADDSERHVSSLQSQLAASEAAQQDLLVQVAAAEVEQQQLQDQLLALTSSRKVLEAKVQEGEAARGDLETQLEGAEADRCAAMAELTEAGCIRVELQEKLEASSSERTELLAQLGCSEAAREELVAQLAAATTTHAMEQTAFAAAERARQQLAVQLVTADGAVQELKQRVEVAEAAAAEATSRAASSERELQAQQLQRAAALRARQHLQERLTSLEKVRDDLQARVAEAEAARNLMAEQAAARATTLVSLQERLDILEGAFAEACERFVTADATARELKDQLMEGEAQRQKLQERLESTEVACEKLQQQMEAVQTERDRLVTQLTKAESARRSLQTQVSLFNTQLAASQDAQVIRRMTQATQLQEQYDRVSAELATERAEAAAREQQMRAELDALKASADAQAVRATARLAIARACWRATDEERLALQSQMQSRTFTTRQSTRKAHGRCSETGQQTIDLRQSDLFARIYHQPASLSHSAAMAAPAGLALSPAMDFEVSPEALPQIDLSGSVMDFSAGRSRSAVAVARCTSSPEQDTPMPISSGPSTSRLQDYKQQLDDVRQRLEAMRPLTASRMAAVEAALEVPSSFTALVQQAVAATSPRLTTSPRYAREQLLLAVAGGAGPQLLQTCGQQALPLDGGMAGVTQQSDRESEGGLLEVSEIQPRRVDLLRDSFSMVPDLGRLNHMLNSNTANPPLVGPPGWRSPSPTLLDAVQSARQQGPTVPFSTPVTAYRETLPVMPRASSYQGSTPEGGVTPSGAVSPTLPGSHAPIQEHLATLQSQLHAVSASGWQLEARLTAARQLPSEGILQTVAARFQAGGQDSFRPPRPPPSLISAASPEQMTTARDSDAVPTPRDAQVIATSLLALRTGLQGALSRSNPTAMLSPSQHRQEQPHPHHTSQYPTEPHSPDKTTLPVASSIEPGTAALLTALLAHVQVLEEQLLGAASLPPLPGPSGMLLVPLNAGPGPGTARYPVPVGRLTVGDGAGPHGVVMVGRSAGRGVYTDGGSTPLEMRSPEHSEQTDSPYVMAIHSPGRQLTVVKDRHHALHHHNQHFHPQHFNAHYEHQLQLDEQQREREHREQQPLRALAANDGGASSAGGRNKLGSGSSRKHGDSARTICPPTRRQHGDSARTTCPPTRRVAPIHVLPYDDYLAMQPPSLISMVLDPSSGGAWVQGPQGSIALQVQDLRSLNPPEAEGVYDDMTDLSTSVTTATAATAATTALIRQSDEPDYPYTDVEWRSSAGTSLSEGLELEEAGLVEVQRAQFSDEVMLTAGPLLLPPPPPYEECVERHSMLASGAGLSAFAGLTVSIPVAVRQLRPGADNSLGSSPISQVFAAHASGSHLAPPSEASTNSDGVCLATPLAFGMVIGIPDAAADTPCLAVQTFNPAEHLLRYNPCFARTPSASELGVGEGGRMDSREGRGGGDSLRGCILEGQLGFYATTQDPAPESEDPLQGSGSGSGATQSAAAAPSVTELGDGLPVLQACASVDVTALRPVRRRTGLSLGSIEERPVTGAVEVPRGVRHSMPYLAPVTGSRDDFPSTSPHRSPSVSGTYSGEGGQPPLPHASTFQGQHTESISLYGSVVAPGHYPAAPRGDPAAYRTDTRGGGGLLCMPRTSRGGNRFPFRLASRLSFLQEAANSPRGPSDDGSSVAITQAHTYQQQPHYQEAPPHRIDLIAANLPAETFNKVKKSTGLLGKIRRVMGASRGSGSGSGGLLGPSFGFHAPRPTPR